MTTAAAVACGRWRWPAEFLRRFLLHVLPPGFVKVRSYGLLANCHRREKLACCRERLAVAAACAAAAEAGDGTVSAVDEGSASAPPCPNCGQGRMIRIDSIVRPSVAELLSRPFHFDTHEPHHCRNLRHASGPAADRRCRCARAAFCGPERGVCGPRGSVPPGDRAPAVLDHAAGKSAPAD